MTNTVFDKTDKGREEIATRKYRLAPRLRTLLVLADGKQSAEDLLKKVTGIGLTESSIAELLEDGFIQPVAVISAPVASVPVSSPPSELHIQQAASSAPPGTGAACEEAVLPEGQNQFQSLYHFYTQTIKSMIGLRGYALQLRVEKASSVADFRELRQPYLEAVLKAKGDETARSLRQRLDQLLYMGESAQPGTTIIDAKSALSE